jgi:hypothetical protein
MTEREFEMKVRQSIVELRKLLDRRYGIDMTDREFERCEDISEFINLAANKIL